MTTHRVLSKPYRTVGRSLATVATTGLLGDTSGIWQSYAPIVQGSSGTLAAYGLKGSYIQSGNLVFLTAELDIVDHGTVPTNDFIYITLPIFTDSSVGSFLLTWGILFGGIECGMAQQQGLLIGGVPYTTARMLRQIDSAATFGADGSFYNLTGLYVVET